jgi:hypothetical protein
MKKNHKPPLEPENMHALIAVAFPILASEMIFPFHAGSRIPGEAAYVNIFDLKTNTPKIM